MRSAAYRSVPLRDRQHVHQALAEATDPRANPDRRVWHLAQAAPEPDEIPAAELEQAAGRAQARDVLAAAAAFGEHAARLTPDPARRTPRALAAHAMLWAGARGPALELLALAESGPLDAFQRARADLVRAQVAVASSPGRGTPLLLEAARRLERHDAGLARAAYLDALHAAMFDGHLAGPGASVREVIAAARASWPAAESPTPFGPLLDGLALPFGEGIPTGMPVLRRALGTSARPGPAEAELRWLRLAGPAARHACGQERRYRWQGPAQVPKGTQGTKDGTRGHTEHLRA